jgi:hypothetical protein
MIDPFGLARISFAYNPRAVALSWFDRFVDILPIFGGMTA